MKPRKKDIIDQLLEFAKLPANVRDSKKIQEHIEKHGEDSTRIKSCDDFRRLAEKYIANE